MGMPVEIHCTACGQESLLKRVPRYDGFKKTGEALVCASCGHEFASEAGVPFKQKREARIFDDSDRPKTVQVFDAHEADRLCRHCKHYVVNPFCQRCGLRNRLVEATDSCERFEKKPV